MRRVLLLLGVGVAACGAALSSANAAQDMSITVQPTAHTQRGLGDHIEISVMLRNGSDHPINVKDGRVEGLYYIDVRDSGGNPLPLTDHGSALYAGGHIFGEGVYQTMLLQPGASLQAFVDVDKVYDMSRPGTYTIQLMRKFEGASGPYYIRSNVVSVTIRQ